MMKAVDFDLPDLEPAPGTGVAGAGGAIEEVPLPPSPVEEAMAEADAIRDAARTEGYEAGRAQAVAEIEGALVALSEATVAVEALRGEIADEVEEAAVDLALRIAGQVLGGALDADHQLVVSLVRGALRRLVERERVTVLVHPDDLEIVRAAAPSLVGELGGMEHLEIQAERRVTRGGAMVRTADGEVDATIETKLERIREVLAETGAEIAAEAEVESVSAPEPPAAAPAVPSPPPAETSAFEPPSLDASDG